MSRNGFIIDLNLCTGCQACELACTIENGLEWGTSWRGVRTFNDRSLPGVVRYHLSIGCNHCDDAPCATTCPALAYRRDERTGALLLDADRCVGCGYCAWACPFDAPVLDDAEGVMTKCTLCNHRLERDQDPACAHLCPTGALKFGDLEGEAGLVAEVPGFPGVEVGPAMRFVPLRGDHEVPETAGDTAGTALPRTAPSPDVRIASEWPLVVFTFLTTVLVAWTGAAAFFGTPIEPVPFAVGAAVVLAASLAHLGRKERAWRAILNLRTSWLSREVALVGVFFGLGVVHALWPRGPGWIGWLATVAGAATLFAVDRVYETVQRDPGSDSHSAQTLLTGLFLAGLFGDNGLIVFVIGIMKLLEYLTRKLRFARQGKPARTLTTVLRVGLGLAAPLGAWIAVGEPFPTWVVVAVVLAEAIDRVEFYLDLEFTSPARETRDAVADIA